MTSAVRPAFEALHARRFGVLLGCALQLCVASAHAEEDAEKRTAARDLATQGAQAFDAGQYAEASDFFRRAHALVGAPSIALMQARSLAKIGRLLEAVDVYEQTARFKLADDAPEAYVTAVHTAVTEVEEVRVRLPRLKLTVVGASSTEVPQVTIDDKPTADALVGVARPVDPGPHKFAVRVAGQVRAAREVNLNEGQSYQVDLDIRPVQPVAKPAAEPVAPPSPRSTRSSSLRTLGFVGLGVGAVGIGIGTYTGLVALHHQSQLDAACHPDCPQSSADDLSGWRGNRTASWLSYGVGVAAAASGVLLLTLGRPEREHIALIGLPSGIQIRGRL
jgi:hypothetical protein